MSRCKALKLLQRPVVKKGQHPSSVSIARRIPISYGSVRNSRLILWPSVLFLLKVANYVTNVLVLLIVPPIVQSRRLVRYKAALVLTITLSCTVHGSWLPTPPLLVLRPLMIMFHCLLKQILKLCVLTLLMIMCAVLRHHRVFICVLFRLRYNITIKLSLHMLIHFVTISLLKSIRRIWDFRRSHAANLN